MAIADVTPRDGANHRVGDDSFFAKLGRMPTASDDESLRMHLHLTYVRERLAAGPPTAPHLAAQRATILGYLDEYIAKGVTPQNTAVPLRTPVFVDDFGNICAVGYLIERATGSRAIPNAIAKAHRFDYLEDIAAAMPEVRRWIEASGFTVDELASIQPGYVEPEVESWVQWNASKLKDGPVERKVAYTGIVTKGAMKRGKMVGTWTNTVHGKTIGKGTFVNGRAAWTSFYQSGALLAKGRFERNVPTGTWTFFHESGHVAAEGVLVRGIRHGQWRFYDDTAAKTPIAKGAFRHGQIVGKWNHYDTKGKLLAVSSNPVKDEMGGEYLLEVVPGSDGVRFERHRIGGPDNMSVSGYFVGGERGEKLYVHDWNSEVWMYSAAGERLVKIEDGNGTSTWRAAQCNWSAKRKRIARAGDTSTMHRLLRYDAIPRDDAGKALPPCGAATIAIDPERAKRLDALMAYATQTVRSPTPAFVKELVRGRFSGAYRDSIEDEGDDDDAKFDRLDTDFDGHVSDEEQQAEAEAEAAVSDLPRVLAAALGWYIEFPHIDGRFVRVFHTVPGYYIRDWSDPPGA